MSTIMLIPANKCAYKTHTIAINESLALDLFLTNFHFQLFLGQEQSSSK